MSTKERILEAAIDLFSARGYAEVGIRDIAAAVGIKESSLYNHFPGKRALLDAALEELQQRLSAVTMTEEQAAAVMVDIGTEQLLHAGAHNLRLYFGDRRMVKLWRILSLERLKDSTVGALYARCLIDDPLHYQAAVFAELMRRGALPALDPDALALAFYAPLFVLVVRHIEGSSQENPADDPQVQAFVARHMKLMGELLLQK